MSHTLLSVLLMSIVIFIPSNSTIWNATEHNIVPGLATNIYDYCVRADHNTNNMNNLLNNQLKPGDTLLFPASNEFWFTGGIYAANLQDITIQIDGSVNFQNNYIICSWPLISDYFPNTNQYCPFTKTRMECVCIQNSTNITFTSSNGPHIKGLVNGNANLDILDIDGAWWGFVNYAILGEDRPRLLHIHNSKEILIENLYFKDSPYWHVYLDDVKDAEIRYCNISANPDNADIHDIENIEAFNTDGFDVSGENIYIHDVDIWNNDDCIAVKRQTGASLQSDCSRNMVFERITTSGLGLTIGSIGPDDHVSCVENIIFRHVYMRNTVKGIYIKSEPGSGTGLISNILYQNITMDAPQDTAIWIGPQQAIYCGQCSLLWPSCQNADCYATSHINFTNIIVRDVTINSPKISQSVIKGNDTNPMRNIIFDNVIVNNAVGHKPFGESYYLCQGVEDFYAKDSEPKPRCNSLCSLDEESVQSYNITQEYFNSSIGYQILMGFSDINQSLLENDFDENGIDECRKEGDVEYFVLQFTECVLREIIENESKADHPVKCANIWMLMVVYVCYQLYLL
eukprot:431032_1